MSKNLFAVFLFILFCSFSLAQQSGDDQGQDKEKDKDKDKKVQQKAQEKIQADAALFRAGCGPAAARFDVKTDKMQHPFVQPEAGRAIVYVFEDDRTAGAFPTTRVGLDGRWMGAN